MGRAGHGPSGRGVPSRAPGGSSRRAPQSPRCRQSGHDPYEPDFGKFRTGSIGRGHDPGEGNLEGRAIGNDRPETVGRRTPARGHGVGRRHRFTAPRAGRNTSPTSSGIRPGSSSRSLNLLHTGRPSSEMRASPSSRFFRWRPILLSRKSKRTPLRTRQLRAIPKSSGSPLRG